MPKPHWEKLHDWCRDDFRDWKWHRWVMLGMLIKNPGHAGLIEAVKLLDKLIASEQKKYKSIYGTKFPMDLT